MAAVVVVFVAMAVGTTHIPGTAAGMRQGLVLLLRLVQILLSSNLEVSNSTP